METNMDDSWRHHEVTDCDQLWLLTKRIWLITGVNIYFNIVILIKWVQANNKLKHKVQVINKYLPLAISDSSHHNVNFSNMGWCTGVDVPMKHPYPFSSLLLVMCFLFCCVARVSNASLCQIVFWICLCFVWLHVYWTLLATIFSFSLI